MLFNNMYFQIQVMKIKATDTSLDPTSHNPGKDKLILSPYKANDSFFESRQMWENGMLRTIDMPMVPFDLNWAEMDRLAAISQLQPSGSCW